MTTILLDFQEILNSAPFTGKLIFTPESYGVDGCTFYVKKPVDLDLTPAGEEHSPAEIELAPSRFVGAYNLQIVEDKGFPTYFNGTIIVPDSGTYCLSALVGAAEIEQSPLFRLVTSVNGQIGDVIVPVGAGGRFEQDFSQGALSNNGDLIVIHSLANEPSSVTVFDQTGEQFDPDQMLILDQNRVQITLGSVAPIVDMWKIVVAL